MREDEFLEISKTFWHHQERSPDLTSGYIFKLISNHTFSISHAVSGNLGVIFAETFRSFFQNNIHFQSHFHFGTFLYDWNGHYDQIHLLFFGHLKTTLVCDRKIQKKTGGNTVKGNVFDFPDNSIRSAFYGCCSFGSNCLMLHTVKIMFFNELIQCGDDGLSSWTNSNLKTVQLDNGFCFLIDKPTTQISWTSSEISVVSLS